MHLNSDWYEYEVAFWFSIFKIREKIGDFKFHFGKMLQQWFCDFKTGLWFWIRRLQFKNIIPHPTFRFPLTDYYFESYFHFEIYVWNPKSQSMNTQILTRRRNFEKWMLFGIPTAGGRPTFEAWKGHKSVIE